MKLGICVPLLLLVAVSSTMAAFEPLEWKEGVFDDRPESVAPFEPLTIEPSTSSIESDSNSEAKVCQRPENDPRWVAPSKFSPDSFGWGYYLPSEIDAWMSDVHDYLDTSQNEVEMPVSLERVTFGYSGHRRPLVAYCLGSSCTAWLKIHSCQICHKLAEKFALDEEAKNDSADSAEEICFSGEIGRHQIDSAECVRIATEMLELKARRLSPNEAGVKAPVERSPYTSICNTCEGVPEDHSKFEIKDNVQRSGIYTSLTHPREASTLSTLLRFVWEMVTANDGNPISTEKNDLCGENEERFNCFKNIMTSTLTWIVPIVNPDTYVYNWQVLKSSRYSNFGLGRKSRDARYCPEREDRMGVDINRNFPTFDFNGHKGMVTVSFKGREVFKVWGTEKTKDLIEKWIKQKRKLPWSYGVEYHGKKKLQRRNPQCEDSFSGVAAASEPETAALVKLFEATRPNFAVHVHSAVPGVIAPEANDLSDEDAALYETLVNSEKTGRLQEGVDDMYKWGSPPTVIGYPGDGDVVTYHTYNTRTWSFGPEVGQRRKGWTPSIDMLQEYGLGILPLMVNCAAMTGTVPPPTTNMVPAELHTFGLEKFMKFIARMERKKEVKAPPKATSGTPRMLELYEDDGDTGSDVLRRSLRNTEEAKRGGHVNAASDLTVSEPVRVDCSPSDLNFIMDVYGFAISRLPDCSLFERLKDSCLDEDFAPDTDVSSYGALCLACVLRFGDQFISDLQHE